MGRKPGTDIGQGTEMVSINRHLCRELILCEGNVEILNVDVSKDGLII